MTGWKQTGIAGVACLLVAAWAILWSGSEIGPDIGLFVIGLPMVVAGAGLLLSSWLDLIGERADRKHVDAG